MGRREDVGTHMRVLFGGQQNGEVEADWQDVMVERKDGIVAGKVDMQSEKEG